MIVAAMSAVLAFILIFSVAECTDDSAQADPHHSSSVSVSIAVFILVGFQNNSSMFIQRLEAHTHWTNLQSADGNSRLIPIARLGAPTTY